MSVCHQLARSTLPSMASTSGCSSRGVMTGWPSVTVPNCAANVGLLGGGEVLVAEEDHMMGVEGLPDLGHHRLAERLGQVDAVDLRADDRGEGPDVEPGGDRHGVLGMGSSVPHRWDLLNPRAWADPRPPGPDPPPRRSDWMWGSQHAEPVGAHGHGPGTTRAMTAATIQAAQLLAVVPGGEPADGHRRGRPAARRRPGAARRLAGPVPGPSGRLLAPWPERVPLDTEVTEETACDGYVRQPDRVRHRGHHVGPRLPAGPRRPGRHPGPAVLAVHGHGPGKSRVCGLEPDDAPGRRLRRRAGPAGPRGAGARPALLR